MKIKLLFVSLLTFCQLLFAQEGLPLYQDYLTSSWYLIHPSMAGAASVNQIRLTGRTQWLDVDDAPSLITGSINGRINKRVGLGAIVFSDTNGNFSENGFYGTFAYHLNLSARETELHQLSFGLSFGVLQNTLDETGFSSTAVAVDPAVFGGSRSDTSFNADFGISYLKQNFFLHISLKNAIPISRNNFLTINDLEPDNERKVVFTTGNTFSIGDKSNKFSLEPSFQYINTPSISEQLIDINAKLYKGLENNNTIWGGIAYRNALEGTEFVLNITAEDPTINTQNFQTLSGFFGIDYKQFVIAYTYTNQIDDIKVSDSGFHQITLGYNFGANSNARSGSKRWDCNCPAANF